MASDKSSAAAHEVMENHTAASPTDRDFVCAICGVSLFERIVVDSPEGPICADCADPDVEQE